MPSDVFRPKLPIDPFGPQLWRIHLPHPIPDHPNSILVLGAPSSTDIAPLATSPRLANSLMVIATHTPPPVPPSSTGPSIIILRLPEPLHVHDSGAVRLVSLLDRAQRVAHAWLTATLSQPRIQQFAELCPGGEFSISEEPEFAPVNHSSVPLAPVDSLDSDSHSTLSTSSSTSSRLSHNKSPHTQTLKQAQFSAIINFLPSGLPDKSLLKYSILVTTLSTSFLASPSSISSRRLGSSSKSSRRSSLLPSLTSLSLSSSTSSSSPQKSTSRSRSSLSSIFYSVPSSDSPHSVSSLSPSLESLSLTTIKTLRPHLIHVLPYSRGSPDLSPPPLPRSRLTLPETRVKTFSERGSANTHLLAPGAKEQHSSLAHNPEKSKLVQSIEQFLLSFTYPSSASSSSLLLPSLSPPPPSHPNQNGTTTRAVLPCSPLSGVDGRVTVQRRSSTAPANLSCLHAGTGSVAGSSAAAAVPYILQAGALGAWPGGGANHPIMATDVSLTIGELIVLGALDTVAVGAPGLGDGNDGVGGIGAGKDSPAWPRAWISCGKDVEVVCPGVGHDASRSRFLDGSVVMADSLGGGVNDGSAKHQHRGLGGKSMTGMMMMSPVGLPTPPDSESNLYGGSVASHASGSSEEGVKMKAVSVAHEPYRDVRVIGVGEARKLRARVASLFGGRKMTDGEKAREIVIARSRRLWGVSRALS